MKKRGVGVKRKRSRRRKDPNSRFLRYTINGIRDSWSYSLAKKEARKKSLIRKVAVGKTKKGYTKYLEYHRCVECPKGVEHVRRNTHVDHIEPVVPPEESGPVLVEPGVAQGFDRYISRLWCDAKNLQVLCKKHHAEKTKKENEIRKARREGK